MTSLVTAPGDTNPSDATGLIIIIIYYATRTKVHEKK